MIKRLLLGTITLGCMLFTVGCSSGVGKKMDDVKVAQEGLLKLTSGKIVVSAGVNTGQKSDTSTTEFTFMKNSSGTFQYCQSQHDRNQKLIFCEVSDGEKAEQWMLGRGWSVIEPKAYSGDSHHRFIELIAGDIDKSCVDSITETPTDNGKLYSLSLNSEKLNKTTYKDTGIEVISQSLTYLLNSEGKLLSYTDTATIFDSSENCNADYTLEAQLSEHDSIKEIVRPEVKASAQVGGAAGEIVGNEADTAVGAEIIAEK